MTLAVGDAGPFVIEETTGKKRKLVLTGRGLPYRPFKLTTKQRVEVVWYPGNPIGTSTILGAIEDPTSINGMWKDKYLGLAEALPALMLDNVQITTVAEAVIQLDDICRSGQLLKVTWDEQVREGHMTEFDKSWQNIHDLEWTISFEWISRGQATVAATFVQETSVSGAAATISSANEDLRDTVNQLSFPSSPEFQVDFLAILDTLDSAVNETLSAVADGEQLVHTPLNVVTRVTSMCTRIIGTVEQLIEFTTSEVAGGFDSTEAVGDQSFQKRLTDGWYFRRVESNARELSRVAIERRAVFLQQLESNLLAIYTAKMNDDLRTVSQLFYGSPFDWRQLMLFNELVGPILSPGQVILVPRLTGPQRTMRTGSVGL